jgi:hypothetical protein
MYRHERIWVFVAQRPSSRLHLFLTAVGPPVVGLHRCPRGRGYSSPRVCLDVPRLASSFAPPPPFLTAVWPPPSAYIAVLEGEVMYRPERIWVFVAQRPSSRLHHRF